MIAARITTAAVQYLRKFRMSVETINSSNVSEVAAVLPRCAVAGFATIDHIHLVMLQRLQQFLNETTLTACIRPRITSACLGE